MKKLTPFELGPRQWLVGGGPRARVGRMFVIVIATALTVPVASFAKTPDQVRQGLVRANLRPRPLYPAILPDPIDNDFHATFSHRRGTFALSYTNCCDSRGALTVAVSFSREPAGAIARAIRRVHAAGDQVSRARVRAHSGYRFITDTAIGFMWKQQGYAYFLSSHCCLMSALRFRDLRAFIGLLAPVGEEWAGRTSQGWRVSLYRSRRGLDWYVGWMGRCDDGSLLGPTWDEDLVGVQRSGSFTDTYAYNFLGDHSTRAHEKLSIRGQLPGAGDGSATGTFSANVFNRVHPSDPHWR